MKLVLLVEGKTLKSIELGRGTMVEGKRKFTKVAEGKVGGKGRKSKKGEKDEKIYPGVREKKRTPARVRSNPVIE